MTVPPATPTPRFLRQAARAFRADEFALFAILAIICIAIGLANPQFWSAENLRDIARSTSFMFIVAVAATLVLISGSLDLSVGSTYGLGGVVAGMAMIAGAPVPFGIAAGLGAGAVVGLLNGLAIVRLHVPSLIVTLGALYVVRGVTLVITGGVPVFPLPEEFVTIGRGEYLGIPIPVWIALLAGIVGHIVLARTVFGAEIYATGGNEAAAHLAGVPIARTRIIVMVISGMAAAAGGILVAARITSAQVNSGTGLELNVIAAVIIGGTSLFGGAGSVLGTLLGALLIAIIANGMILVRLNPFYQSIVIGFIIVIAVAIDGWRRRRTAEA